MLSNVALTSFVIGLLYFARDTLIPLALASLLTFLLAPLVTRFERWVGRIAAVLVVVTMIFAALGAAGWVLTRQFIDLATKLPDYKGNIVAKLHSFRTPRDGALSELSKTVDDLKKELPGVREAEPAVPIPDRRGSNPNRTPAAAAAPVQVEISKSSPFETLQSVLAPLLGPLGTAALVILLVVFMLLQREDLRSRVIRLIGQGHISKTTRAMDDAGKRVSRYLLMQLVVNVTYGIPVAIGLYFIGVPNAILWGVFATVLRFIPYIGSWIASAFPVALSLAVSPTWTMPLLTVALFVVLELLSNNVLEPWLYSSSTGVSNIALIVAAVFWTWLWGPVGLVLATPLTVCLVVMGRHVARLSFLAVLLSDEEALTPAEDFYHRLLSPSNHDDAEFVESYLKTNSLTALYDAVFVPVIAAAESDIREELLDANQLVLVEQSLRDIVLDLGSRPPVVSQLEADKAIASTTASGPPVPPFRVYCVPARAERDELAGVMLAHLLESEGNQTWSAPPKLSVGDLLGLVAEADVDVVCISVVPPSTVIHARYLCSKVRARLPQVKIVVGLWGATEGATEPSRRLRDSGADEVVLSLAEAVLQISKLALPAAETGVPAPIPDDELERQAAVDRLQLAISCHDFFFDRITAKIARIFEVPIALLTLVDRDRQIFKSQVGLPEELAQKGEAPREHSVCGHVVATNQLTVVEDLARDRRFTGNSWIREQRLRFYAGVPLQAEGQAVGSLCLLDVKPRQFTPRDARHLQEYANEIMEEFTRRSLPRDLAGTV